MGGCKFGETFLHGCKFVLQIGFFVTESLGFIRRGAGCRGPSITERAKRPGSETPAGPPAEKAPGATAAALTGELATAATATGAARTKAPSGARSLFHRFSSLIAWHDHDLLCSCAVS